jgi:Tol biopolymer transport system component
MFAATCVALLTATSAGPAQAAVEPGPTEIVSAGADGAAGDDISYEPRVSADGRFVAFQSMATDLISSDTNAVSDVFVKDTSDGSIERVSVDEQGEQLASRTSLDSISGNGRYVLFTSRFERVEEHGKTVERVVTRLADRRTGTSRRIERRTRNGTLIRLDAAQLSGNGRFVVFSTARRLVRSDRDRYYDLYRLDVATGALRRVTVKPIDASGSLGSRSGSVSHNGRFIAFLTGGRLVKRDHRDDQLDVYVRDMRKRRPQLVSRSSSGAQAWAGSTFPSIAANGRYVLFTTRARNLVRHDTNREQDLFVRDLRAGTTKRVSVNSREHQGDQHTGPGSISDNGRFVVFHSRATNLSPGTTDFGGGPRRGDANIFVRDRRAGTTRAITMAPDGTGANDTSSAGIVSRDGSTVVFFSHALNLVEGASGDNVFLRRLEHTRR